MATVAAFEDIQDDFIERVSRMVWCNMATIDPHNRVRSRVVHPVWDGSTGWLTTRPNSRKRQHLSHNPAVSLAYVADVAQPVYVECHAEWVDDLATKQQVWNLCRQLPAPMGFDPSTIYGTPDSESFGVLRLTPWMIRLQDAATVFRVWKP